ncbi:MAG: Aspartate racemase [Burkholderiaceae bacterium]|jgi:aspartate racemase|nr:MAG: Aspartate racemase [Burkholderiaceae bacterium]
MTPRRIGILGGMGPEATVLLMQRIIARTPASDDADHIPMLVDNNPQVPSRIAALIEGTGEDPGPVLAGMARRLEAGGCEALAMPCNTAHHYAAAIQSAVTIPLLNMIELTCDWVAGMAIPRVGLLASPAVQRTGLFDRPLARRGIETLHPADSAPLLAAIRAVKAGQSQAAEARFADAAAELQAAGAGVLLVVCSELSVIVHALSRIGPVVDSIDVLAAAVVDFALPSTLPSK